MNENKWRSLTISVVKDENMKTFSVAARSVDIRSPTFLIILIQKART